MVELTLNSSNYNHSEPQEPSKAGWLANCDTNNNNLQTSSEQIEQIDRELVSETRKRIKREIELDESIFGLYSEEHYEEIIKQEPPFTCWRYILHSQRKPDVAVKLMRDTLIWRHENQVDDIDSAEMVKEFWHFTPIVKCGKDKAGNSVYYIVGKNYRKPDSSLRQIIRRFTLSILFGWDKQHRDSFKKMTIIFDVSDTGFQNIDLEFMSWLVGIRDNLPARIANLYVIGIPILIRPIVKLIISWLPENYSSLVHCGTYDDLIKSNIEDQELPVEVGGTNQDNSNRLAPIEAPWMADSTIFGDPAMQQAVEWAIGFSVNEATRNERRQYQLNYEEELRSRSQV